jgi:putative endonuclease
MKGYMYILRCANGEYYTGSTNDLQKRLEEHNNGIACNFTWKHMPVELVYTEEFARVEEAFHREKQIQKWSRKKKEALISGDIQLLKSLARNHTDFKKDSIQKILPGL